jgi:multidrug efflux pump subunit AcrA (membrane-fusion protein)
MRKMLKIAASGAMLVALAGTTGCATTADLNALQAQVDSAKATADKAIADAAAAQASAAAAQACCDANSVKMDRMFEQSMSK